MKTPLHPHPFAGRCRLLLGWLTLWITAFGVLAQDAAPCHGIVQKIVQRDGTITYQLICEGECPDGGRCAPRRSQNHHGGIREWCGCGEQEPQHCHIVLYRPGPGEGGGEPRVFCAGTCPDGHRCQLQEVLIQETDGHRVFHLRCLCLGENEPHPDDQSTPDPTNDDDDEAPCCDDAKPCKGYVQKVVQADGTVTFQLGCRGTCPDGRPCQTHRRENHHGGIREWCGCEDTEPRDCHIVLYRPGRGEGGGEPRVFCAGACADGRACRIQETLVAQADGTKVFRYTCECPANEEQPEEDPQDPTQLDDEPGTSEPDPTNDDDDEAPCCDDAKPCKGYVQKVVQADGTVTFQLGCRGTCPDGRPCQTHRRENHHGGIREWCGCEDTEPRGCHIVLYRPGRGEGGGEPRVFCAGACPDGRACRIQETLVAQADGTKVFRYTCECPDNEAAADLQTPNAKRQALARRLHESASRDLRVVAMPMRGERHLCLEFTGIPETRYRVLVTSDFQEWSTVGEASLLENGRFQWIDEHWMDGTPRFYIVEEIDE